MLKFLMSYPGIVNEAPNKLFGHRLQTGNPLELAIKIGHQGLIEKLLILGANVRPENRHLLKHIKHLLKPELNDPSNESRFRP